MRYGCMYRFFFFNDPRTTEIYTLSLHDALPIFVGGHRLHLPVAERVRALGVLVEQHELVVAREVLADVLRRRRPDRKSTRLNSSHANISYAVFCLKKKNLTTTTARKLADLAETN